ncbi:hypothetical protein BS329_15330 [Amycolatopsis coloradensis]|uniref:Uncharacterized protein n=1 Tax=Amycolatopsis coloradensis TaxID=76021 RepID=A0A1R0KU28_9PSEU|nr:hypothetical protein [Amycolatopsis coloradensis]OLZ51637.1 hypothetical protein BS329_15330 [Amycolatopsis coloradensis]
MHGYQQARPLFLLVANNIDNDVQGRLDPVLRDLTDPVPQALGVLDPHQTGRIADLVDGADHEQTALDAQRGKIFRQFTAGVLASRDVLFVSTHWFSPSTPASTAAHNCCQVSICTGERPGPT